MSDDLKRQIEEALRPLISERDILKAERAALLRELDVLAASYVTQLANLQRESEALRAERDALQEQLRDMTAAQQALMGVQPASTQATLRVEMHVTGTVVVVDLIEREPENEEALLRLQNRLLETARRQALLGFASGGTRALKISKVEFQPLWPPRA